MDTNPDGVAELRWAVVLPVKALAVAKSRLSQLRDADRADLALAMAADVVVAAASCPVVDLVVVVTNDLRAAEALGALGAVVVADLPDAGLDQALLEGERAARDLLPEAGVAALSADLPSLTAADLARALRAAASYDRAVVADAEGTGTALLTARTALAPHYGPASWRAHVAAGAQPVVDAPATVRRDVDTPADLAAARLLGVGAHTTAALGRVGMLADTD